MAFSMAGGGPSRPEVNVTPLIDILLVLIIVFMGWSPCPSKRVWRRRFRNSPITIRDKR